MKKDLPRSPIVTLTARLSLNGLGYKEKVAEGSSSISIVLVSVRVVMRLQPSALSSVNV